MPSIDLTPANSLLIQLAQDKRQGMVSNAQSLVAQANKLMQDGENVLRTAVERVLLESMEELPKASVNIRNGEDGAPCSLAWDDPEDADAGEGVDVDADVGLDAGAQPDEGAPAAEPPSSEDPAPAAKKVAANGMPKSSSARPQPIQRKAIGR